MERETIGMTMAIGAAVGALGGKLIDRITKREKLKIDEATKIREELREHVDKLEARVNELYTAIDEWKNRYYMLVQENMDLRAECKSLRSEIEECLKSCPIRSPSSPTSKP